MLSFLGLDQASHRRNGSRTASPRAVVLIGPPKTGSTHLQGFLVANREHLLRHGWQWPRGRDGEPAGAKSLANLATALWKHSCHGMWNHAPSLATAIVTLCHGRASEQRLYRGPHAETLAYYQREFARVAASSHAPNLVISAEDLALFDGDGAADVAARAALRRLLAPFGSVEVVMVYRTPRAQAVQSVFTEDLDYGHEGVVLGGHHTLSAWLYEKLGDGSLLRTAPEAWPKWRLGCASSSATTGHHGLHRLHLKGWGCPPHS